jgi:ABC-type amino acid transport substrate-binding protein
MKVAVVDGDSGQQIADAAGLETLVVPGYPDAVKAVAEGRAGAAILDELVGVYYVNQFGYTDEVGPAGPAVDEGQMTLPVQKDDTILLGILAKAQQSISDQELDDIVATWLESE